MESERDREIARKPSERAGWIWMDLLLVAYLLLVGPAGLARSSGQEKTIYYIVKGCNIVNMDCN
uniref:Uncharacterized protein n=1 Tax=Oryza punctata TaxID=4537 RepID=A0A0E0LR42_ORYPU